MSSAFFLSFFKYPLMILKSQKKRRRRRRKPIFVNLLFSLEGHNISKKKKKTRLVLLF